MIRTIARAPPGGKDETRPGSAFEHEAGHTAGSLVREVPRLTSGPGRLYGLAWRVTPRLPGPVAALVFDAVAAAMRWSGAGGVHQLRVNLAQALGHAADSPAVTAVAGRGVHSYLRYWRELFGLAGWSPERIRDGVVLVYLDWVEAARGAV